MKDPIEIVPYNEEWVHEFASIGRNIREVLGEAAIRIDHIGSTSIRELAAKPVIDIQISVRSLEPVNAYKTLLESIGFMHRSDNPDLTKRYFREIPGFRRTHIHVRERGSWSEQFALLFRDYLREHPGACDKYVQTKYKLMELYRNEREKYVDGKGPIIWEIMALASEWSQQTGWKPAQSDA
jgi:GrpB-like predicted nucleotidyltransferase (UPF0157 family)